MSTLDPFGLWRAGFKVVGWTERRAAELVRSRLFPDGLPGQHPLALGTSDPLETRMRRLLDRSLQQTSAGSRLELFERLVDELVPDEARILAALSDGSSSPLLHVRDRSKAHSASDLVLENASLIGRTANLTLVTRTPLYVAHLLSLGLVEIGAEDPALKEEYEILLADPAVLRALKSAGHWMRPPRVERHTLQLSALGHELWQATSSENGEQP